MTEHRSTTRGDEGTDTPQEGLESVEEERVAGEGGSGDPSGEEEREADEGGSDSGEEARGPSGEVSDEELQEEVDRLAEDPPTDLKDWPDGPAKYKTLGGPEGDHSYEEGPERALGPSSLRRHEDGSVEIEGETVDNPEDYKQESIEDPLGKQD